MFAQDFIRLTLSAVVTQRLRSVLTALGIAIGIAAVVLLTSLGEGIHRFIASEFTQFGTNLIAVAPGKATTAGISGAVISNVRPLSLADAQALERVPAVKDVVPFVQGNAAVESGRRTRRTTIFGTGPEVPEVWKMNVAVGRFLPDDDPRAARAFAVLGSKLRDELFGDASPLGERIRIGSERYRVIGVMESKGRMLGFDLDDTVYIPVAKALAMFNRESLMEIDLVYKAEADADRVAEDVRRMLVDRHGHEDFTITTQEEMLEVLGSILNIVKMAVGAIGGISLLVGAVGILTIMTIAVTERTGEIGLLRALGAGRRQILSLFLGEAVVLASIGGAAGLALGAGGAWLLGAVVPALPTHTPWLYALLAEALAATIGLVAGVLPAHRASRLNPVEALRAE